MNEVMTIVAAVPAPVAGVSAVAAGMVAVVLDRRLRRNREQVGIRRHDGSGRVWEFEGDPPLPALSPPVESPVR